MSGFGVLDLSRLSPPDVVERLDYETILGAMRAELLARAPTLAPVLALESEPAVKILEAAACRELLLRARINDAAKAVLLATAPGADLDHLAALFGVARFVLDPGDPEAAPPVAPTLENDGDLRYRTQLALEGFRRQGAALRDAFGLRPRPAQLAAAALGSADRDGAAGGAGRGGDEGHAVRQGRRSRISNRPVRQHPVIDGKPGVVGIPFLDAYIENAALGFLDEAAKKPDTPGFIHVSRTPSRMRFQRPE